MNVDPNNHMSSEWMLCLISEKLRDPYNRSRKWLKIRLVIYLKVKFTWGGSSGVGIRFLDSRIWCARCSVANDGCYACCGRQRGERDGDVIIANDNISNNGSLCSGNKRRKGFVLYFIYAAIFRRYLQEKIRLMHCNLNLMSVYWFNWITYQAKWVEQGQWEVWPQVLAALGQAGQQGREEPARRREAGGKWYCLQKRIYNISINYMTNIASND